jgi:Bacterial regulatory helix-turn-helix protein, lysR family
MRISIRLIETFVRVVERGSFTAAARSLLIDPAAVSRGAMHLSVTWRMRSGATTMLFRCARSACTHGSSASKRRWWLFRQVQAHVNPIETLLRSAVGLDEAEIRVHEQIFNHRRVGIEP